MKVIHLNGMQIGVGDQPDGSCVLIVHDDREQFHIGLTVEGRKDVGRLLLGIAAAPKMVVPGSGRIA